MSEHVDYEVVLDEHVLMGDMLLDPRARKAHVHPDTDLRTLIPKLHAMKAELVFEARKTERTGRE